MLPIIIPGNARRTVLFDEEAGTVADPELIGAVDVSEVEEGVEEMEDRVREFEIEEEDAMLVVELEGEMDEIEEGIAVVVSAVEGGEVDPPKTQTSPEPRGIC